MSLGGGYQQSESEQKSQSLGPLGSASGTIRGQGQNLLADLLYGRQRTGAGGILDDLRGRTGAPVQYEAPNIVGGVRNAFQEAVNQAVGRESSLFSRRGFNRPENIQALVGSAVQNVAPQFAPYYAEQARAESQAPLIREDIMRNRFMDLLQALGVTTTALGGESTSYGSSKSMGVQAQGSATPETPAKCWIAAVFYGEGSLEQSMIRSWLDSKATRSWGYLAFVKFYERCGRWIASTLRHETVWKQAWRTLFAYFLREARHA